jgi:thiol-disulfide isomerase/thioredoxin
MSILGIFALPQSGKCENLQDTKWSVEIIKNINETANSASEVIKAGSMLGIDSLIKYITERWQTYNIQEHAAFDGEIEKAESLGILINMVSNNIQQLKDAYDFDEANKIQNLLVELIISSKEILRYISKPVLLVFIGPKCKSWPDCKAGQRTMESVDNIASKFASRIRIAFIDVKQKKRLAKQYKIMLAPTLVFIDCDGKEVYRRSGETTFAFIEEQLKKLFGE